MQKANHHSLRPWAPGPLTTSPPPRRPPFFLTEASTSQDAAWRDQLSSVEIEL